MNFQTKKYFEKQSIPYITLLNQVKVVVIATLVDY
jgi:hypothetical protein